MKKILVILFAKLLILCMVGSSSAFFINFEDGRDGGRINDIDGISFKNFSGFDAVYGDSSSGKYHTYSDDQGQAYNDAFFHHNGDIWLWAGREADARGVIVDFTNNNGTWFKTGYSTYGDFIMKAHLTNGRTVSASGSTNTDLPMRYLTVRATRGTYIDYVVLTGAEGNVWLVDDMSGDTTGVESVVPDPPAPPPPPPPPPVPGPNSDDDGDGMPYAWENTHGLNPSVNDASGDPDRDGLSNFEEYQRGTNPKKADTDGDGMPDGWEADKGLNPVSNDASKDPDRDGLSNLEEYQKGTDPRNADSDSDGMPDGWEVSNGLNPRSNDGSADSDRDGLANLNEYKKGTNPKKADTDGDGMPDGWEVSNSLNPRANDSSADSDRDGLANLDEYRKGTNPRTADTDADGMPDGWEVTHSFNPRSNDSAADPDRDGVSNVREYQKGTDPRHADTDGDGMPDGWEMAYNLNPRSVNDAPQDPDGDGVSNLDEYIAGTNPRIIPGEFMVGDSGVVAIDWLYDGGMFEGEIGIFTTSGMKAFISDPETFIAEAVRRALSNTTEGYLVLSDPEEGARLSGVLGEPDEWNSGPYNGVKEFNMRRGDTFAIILVPNTTLETLLRVPLTTNPNIRPLFSIALSNLDYGMHVGQMADINGYGNAFAFEDQDFEKSDMDYNDLILQITGAVAEVPSLDSVIASYETDGNRQARRKRDDRPMLFDAPRPAFNWHDWRTSDALGMQIIEHAESPLPDSETLWMSVNVDASADLIVYDPQGRAIGKEGGYIPGATFKIAGNGQQIVSLPALEDGNYRIMLLGKGDGGNGTLTVTGCQGDAEISEMTVNFEIDAHQLLKTTVSASVFAEEMKIAFEAPKVPKTPGGSPLFYDFDGNGKIDSSDIIKVSSRWNSSEGDQDYDAFYDLDNDGYIGILDIMPVVNGQ